MKSYIRTAIRTSIQAIRETRADRSVSCCMGQGWTVAVRDSNSVLSIESRDGDKVAYSFGGSWNRRSVYYSKSDATRILYNLRESRPELSLVRIHHDDLRDRQEKSALECLASCLPHRNHKG